MGMEVFLQNSKNAKISSQATSVSAPYSFDPRKGGRWGHCWNLTMSCERVRPLQESKTQKSGKEGFRNPRVSTGLNKENGDFSTQILRWWEMGVF